MDFDKLCAQLPTSTQSFADMRRTGTPYVDKTLFVYKIAALHSPLILTRPLGFGASTLHSTLEELFLHGVAPYDGHDSYFKGLAIEQLWQDQGQYLVLRLNFHELAVQCNSVEQFELNLTTALTKFCRAHDLTVPEDALDSADFFGQMFEQLSNRSLVLLVDKYDYPLMSFASNETELAACTELMRCWFGSIKNYEHKFRCVFCTGITRYYDIDLASAGNNFSDVTHYAYFAACCGYTRDELKQYFADHLRYAAATRAGCAPAAVSTDQIEDLLDDMAQWFGGYSFAVSQQAQDVVYDPWAVLHFFSDRQARLEGAGRRDESLGVPELLKLALERCDLKQLLDKLTANHDDHGDIVINGGFWTHYLLHPYSLLCNSGYLTLTQPARPPNYPHLTWPNRERRVAFAHLVARSLLKQRQNYEPEFIEQAFAMLERLAPEIRCARVDV